MFKKVVVANRGDVARRVIRALRSLGIHSVAVYSEADKQAPHVLEADEAYFIGEAPALASYLNREALLQVIRESGADGVHPGYGFLSENAEFALAAETMGVRFIGPSSRLIRDMSQKSLARERMAGYGMPICPGSGILPEGTEAIKAEGRRIGFPILVKPAGGGGGIGMLVAHDEEELIKAVERARALAVRLFSNDGVYLEKYIRKPRHIEFQVLGDRHGNLLHLFERDCSVQRRYQKLIEESPAPLLNREELDDLSRTVSQILRNMEYDNIGTVEMLRENDGSYYFLEMNTRLQVEHAVTEEITGIDLVVSQIRSAAGERISDFMPKKIERCGHAIEARVYAEDPKKFYPSPGKLNTFRPPSGKGIRVETGYREGLNVTPYYDPMVAKVIAHAETRDKAISRLVDALSQFEIAGIQTNLVFLAGLLSADEYGSGEIHTGLVKDYLSK